MLGALIGGGLSLLGGIFGSNASKSASNAQTKAAQQAIAEQRRQFDITRADHMPYLQAGTTALGQQGDLLGMNGPEAQAAAIARLQASPQFQSLFNAGQETILQNASATGGLRGGNVQRSLADFGADTLAQTIERQLAQLGGISGRGQQGAGTVGQFGANAATNIGNFMGQMGSAQAAGHLGSAAAWNSALNSAFRSLGPALDGWSKKMGWDF